MKPILPGGRGAAVEDVQRRLMTLGYDLGPTGVDGVFLGRTREALVAFQQEHRLAEDGIVGAETWSALVDATFTLGDRMLYLRLPHFHGNDVRVLQEALNALGFSSGDSDGIFGSLTERAVREFQRNCGQAADGIVGPETVGAIDQLRHVWEGKTARPRESGGVAPARLSGVLSRFGVAFVPCDEAAEDVATRAVNLALATDGAARVMLASEEGTPEADVVLRLRESMPAGEVAGPIVSLVTADRGDLSGRLRVALEVTNGERRPVVTVVLGKLPDNERERQRVAIALVDGVCLALA